MASVSDMFKAEAVSSMADFLMSYGFQPKEAFIESENFWNKHKKKLVGVIPYE